MNEKTTPPNATRRDEGFLAKMKEELQVIEEQMKTMKISAGEEYREQLESLRKRKEAASSHLRKLEDASDEVWDDMKQGAEKGWAELKTALADAKSKLKGKS